MLLFQVTLSGVNGLGIFNTTIPVDNGWTYSSVASGYGCTTVNNGAVGNCNSGIPNTNFFTSLISTFGDWVDTIYKFVLSFSTGVFVPYWIAVNSFHLPPWFGLIWQIGAIVCYGSIFSHLLGNRNLES